MIQNWLIQSSIRYCFFFCLDSFAYHIAYPIKPARSAFQDWCMDRYSTSEPCSRKVGVDDSIGASTYVTRHSTKTLPLDFWKQYCSLDISLLFSSLNSVSPVLKSLGLFV